MSIKIKRIQIILITISVLVLSILLILERPTIESLLFYLNIIIGILIIGVAQFSLFSIITVISNYMLANVYLVYKTKVGYGLLGMTSHIFIKEMDILLLMLNISILIWIMNSTLLKREKNFIKAELKLSKNTCNILAFLAIIFSYIAFPGFEFGITTNRFQSLLPGHFWNHLMIIFMIFAAMKIKEGHFIKFSILAISVWVLLHGERVDIIGFYTLLFLRYCVKKKYKINIKFFARFWIVIVAFFTLLIFVGERRVGGSYAIRISSIVSSFLSQGTASDVGYVFNSAIDYVNDNILLWGRTYITYIQGIIPFLNQPLRAGAIIQNIYGTAGGEYFLVEPLINFGYFGVLCSINIILALIHTFLNKLTVYKSIIYLFIIATTFRFIWYGFTYIETGILYLIPITYCLSWFIGGKPKIRKGDVFND